MQTYKKIMIKSYPFGITLFCFFIILLQFELPAQKNISADWQTYFEKSDFTGTPSYEESMEYFRKFEKISPYFKINEFGVSPQGRKMFYIIISKEKSFTPESLKKSALPLLFINNGIHSGEIEGKDATMLLLREIFVTEEKKDYLNSANVIIIPVFSVDGHERKSKYNRINQNGPEEMGWRTTAQNFNLNRDWIKADAPEMQAMLKLISSAIPDFFIDNHTTNGADYQYTITYGLEKFKNIDDSLAAFTTELLIPALEKDVEADGFLIAPYVGFKGDTPESGLMDWASTPRFSTGYMAVQNRIALLVETHMMKPYKDRVYATKSIMESVFRLLGIQGKQLKKLNRHADSQSITDYSVSRKYFPASFRTLNDSVQFLYKGFTANIEQSIISGTSKVVYTAERYEKLIPFFNNCVPVDSIRLPYAYIIPAEYGWLADKLRLHGVAAEPVKSPFTAEVTRYKFKSPKFSASPYEGRQSVTVEYDSYSESVFIPAGSYIVYTGQRGVRVIATALEPKSADSFLRWGFMNGIFERKEYFEDYVMEKVALEMYKNSPALASEFDKKVSEDEKFRTNPNTRLNWFYERSPYFDKQYMVYPVMRIEEKMEK